MSRLLVRADGGPKLGGGHIYRCMTLARVLLSRGWDVTFCGTPETLDTVALLSDFRFVPLARELSQLQEVRLLAGEFNDVDLLLVDHYQRDAEFEQACSFARLIMVVDDLADRPHHCDLLLDQTVGRLEQAYRTLVPQHCELLLGTDYALLRPEFRAVRQRGLDRRAKASSVRNLLVMGGATDPTNLTALVLDALESLELPLAVTLVLHPQVTHFPEIEKRVKDWVGASELRLIPGSNQVARLMNEADLSVGAAGSTSWERCCLGLPSLTVEVADNQALIARELGHRGAAMVLGRAGQVEASQIAKGLRRLAHDHEYRRAMISAGAGLVDGLGVERVIAAIERHLD